MKTSPMHRIVSELFRIMFMILMYLSHSLEENINFKFRVVFGMELQTRIMLFDIFVTAHMESLWCNSICKMINVPWT